MRLCQHKAEPLFVSLMNKTKLDLANSTLGTQKGIERNRIVPVLAAKRTVIHQHRLRTKEALS